MSRQLLASVAIAAAFTGSVRAGVGEEEPATGLPLSGEEAERYLGSAEVVEVEDLPTGITDPRKVTLRRGGLVAHAIFKTIDERRSGLTRYETGRIDQNYRDSFKHEIAAYELDKLIGAKLVPPTVERYIDVERGSLQLWVEGAVTDIERRQQEKIPPDPGRFADALQKVELFRNLTHDMDAANFSNVLVDGEFRVYAIDHSRAFRLEAELVREEQLRRFSRKILSRLRKLDRASLESSLGDWLTGLQIEAILKRRDLITQRADRLVRKWGEGAVLYGP